MLMQLKQHVVVQGIKLHTTCCLHVHVYVHFWYFHVAATMLKQLKQHKLHATCCLHVQQSWVDSARYKLLH